MPRTHRLLAASLGLALSATTFVGPAVTAAHAASPGASAASFITSEVAPDIDAYWRQQSRAAGVRYVTPKLVLFDSAHPVLDACSDDAVEGHEYCPADSTIYLDVGTDNEASFGRLWGHAIQDQRRGSGPRLSGIQKEQQADCLSGTFARYAERRGWLEKGDLDAAMALALRSGDSGHGPGWQREMAFELGYEGSLAACGLG